MTGKNIEGTIVFDGLLQGRLPDDEAAAKQLREWVEFVGKLGLRFNLEERGTAFSLLPDDAPCSAKKLGDAPEDAVTQALQQLADALPPGERGQLFSTLRSSEFKPKIEVQTVYSIAAGNVRCQSRTVEAETTTPEIPLSPKERLKMALVGVVVAGVIVGVALLFPGVRAMFGQVVETATPIDVNRLQIDAGPYEPWIEASFDAEKSGRGKVTIVVKARDAFPRDDAAWESAANAADLKLRNRLALENLARGQIRLELFDESGIYIASSTLRTHELSTEKPVIVPIIMPEKVRIAKFVFTP